jgi:hypothetical protein
MQGPMPTEGTISFVDYNMQCVPRPFCEGVKVLKVRL